MAKRLLSCWVLSLVALVLVVGQALAGSGEAGDIKGWEHGSEYDKLYDPKDADTLKGRVTKIYTFTPAPGMAEGIAIQVEDKKDKGLETVHVGPKSAVDLAAIGLKVGDQVKVFGAWTDMDDQDVLLASKIKKEDGAQLKVRRTKDGFPFWSMTPEERTKEVSQD